MIEFIENYWFFAISLVVLLDTVALIFIPLDNAALSKLRIFWFEYVLKSTSAMLVLLIHSLVAIAVFLVLEGVIEEKIAQWMVPIFIKIEMAAVVSIIIIMLLFIQAWYQVRSKNFSVKTYEVVLLALYIKYQFLDPHWEFYPYGDRWTIFDLIPLFIIYPKVAAVLSFFLTTRNGSSTKGVIDPDMPLNDVNPVDELGRQRFATELVEVLRNTRPSQRALVIGINGSWGSGKTSLQYLIARALAYYKSQFLLVDFNPWLHSHNKSLSHAFLSILTDKIRPEQHLISQTIDSYAKTFVDGTDKIMFTSTFARNWITEPTLEQELEAVKNRVKNLEKTVIVTIDDLDRLSGDEVIEVLRLIRLVGDFPNTIYIVLYDKEYVSHIVREKLCEYNPHVFIDKIIQVEYAMPESITDSLRQIFIKHLSRALTEAVPESVSEWNEDIIKSTIEFPSFNEIIKHVRDIKRFSNNFLLRYKSIFEDVNFSQFLLLELMRFRIPYHVTIIFNAKDVFVAAIERAGTLEIPEPVPQHPFWTVVARDECSKQILNEIAKYRNNRKSMSTPYSFNHYFTLLLQGDYVSEKHFTLLVRSVPTPASNDRLYIWAKNSTNALIYQFRSFEIDSLDILNCFVDHLITASNHINNVEATSGGSNRTELPKVLVGKYQKLISEKVFNEADVYKVVCSKVLNNQPVNEALRATFLDTIKIEVNAEYLEPPTAHGWYFAGSLSDIYPIIYRGEHEKFGKFWFMGPSLTTMQYDLKNVPSYLRWIKCTVRHFGDLQGAFRIRVCLIKGSERMDVLMQLSEQPENLGETAPGNYVMGLKVDIESDWYVFEFNIDQEFRKTPYIAQGYKLDSILGISISGKLGFGKFELY